MSMNPIDGAVQVHCEYSYYAISRLAIRLFNE